MALSGARPGSARQPLFEHLGDVLGPLGVAVLTYDRRPAPAGGDTSVATQAADAVVALAALRDRLGVPVGLFGFSQGAWAATRAAVVDRASRLVVVGHSGVSPAEQMRHHVDERLRRRGFTPEERDRAASLRLSYEEALRGAIGVGPVNGLLLAAAAEHAWFPLTYLPGRLPSHPGTWEDMDRDPRPDVAAVHLPTLAVWGEREDVVPLDASRRVWEEATGPVTQVILPGCGHWPTVGSDRASYSGWGVDDLPSPEYGAALVRWYQEGV